MQNISKIIRSLNWVNFILVIRFVSLCGRLVKFIDSDRKVVFVRINVIIVEVWVVFIRFLVKVFQLREFWLVVSIRLLIMLKVVVLVVVVKFRYIDLMIIMISRMIGIKNCELLIFFVKFILGFGVGFQFLEIFDMIVIYVMNMLVRISFGRMLVKNSLDMDLLMVML